MGTMTQHMSSNGEGSCRHSAFSLQLRTALLVSDENRGSFVTGSRRPKASLEPTLAEHQNLTNQLSNCSLNDSAGRVSFRRCFPCLCLKCFVTAVSAPVCPVLCASCQSSNHLSRPSVNPRSLVGCGSGQRREGGSQLSSGQRGAFELFSVSAAGNGMVQVCL